MLVPTKQGRMQDLKLMLSKNLMLRLFTNDIDPEYGHGAGDFEEVSGDDYTSATLRVGEWQYAFSPKNNPVALYPEMIFSFRNSGFVIYGYFVTDKQGVIVRWAERFPEGVGPYSILRKGDLLTVVPKCELVWPKKY